MTRRPPSSSRPDVQIDSRRADIGLRSAPSRHRGANSPASSTWPRLRAWSSIAAVGLLAASCLDADDGLRPNVATISFSDVNPTTDPLTSSEVDAIVESTAQSIDAPFMAIAVVDRIGNILRVWNRNPASAAGDYDNDIAVSVARTAAYLSHSQAPLTSRTGQFISTFHFPVTFDEGTYTPPFDPTATSPTRPTMGVANTGQGPLWQIDASNRGVVYGPFDAAQSLPRLRNPDNSTPSPGFTALPGGIPLYKRTCTSIMGVDTTNVQRRLVGAVGVWVTSQAQGLGTPDPEGAEFAALQGSRTIRTNAPTLSPPEDYAFAALPPEGAVYLVGILLPFSGTQDVSNVYGPGTYNAADTVVAGVPAQMDPFEYLISPRDSTVLTAGGEGLTANEVQVLVDSTVTEARRTHAAIRLPPESPCAMVIAVTDIAGEILALNRMEDATLFSADIAITKARNTFYFSNSASTDTSGPRMGNHPLDGIVPPGTAITCRTLGFLTQPFYPPGIDGNEEGPLYQLALENRKPVRHDQMGFAAPGANQSGLILFPGSAPLYKNGVLVGGIGVSGDGVEQDDFVTFRGIQRGEAALGIELEPPASMRADAFEFRGVRLPYMKFPQHPGG